MTFNLEIKDRSYAKLSNVLRSCYAMLNQKTYSTAELKYRQCTKGYDEELVDQAIKQLTEDGYLNDEQFAQGYFNSQLNKNYGPIRIKRNMMQKKIPGTLIENLLDESEFIWTERAIEIRQKKFGDIEMKIDQKLKAKIWRFLSYRGFFSDDIKNALNPNYE